MINNTNAERYGSQIDGSIDHPSHINHAFRKKNTPLTNANSLLRNCYWEEAALAYMNVLECQPSLRSIVSSNIVYLLKKAPKGSISAKVVEQLLLVRPSPDAFCKKINNYLYGGTETKSSNNDINYSGLSRAIKIGLGVEQIYVVNLRRRSDRYIRFLREMNFHGLRVKRIEGVDGLTSTDADILLKEFTSRPLVERRRSSAHISDTMFQGYKSGLTTGVFGYILSQAKVLNDAAKEGYKRILVLDDDIFFCSDASSRLNDICRFIPNDLKILALGTSEYSDRLSEEFIGSRIYNHRDLYQPIPGKTCGSFAMVYDNSVYVELIEAINEADGTFDNVILGSIYLNNPGKCVAVDPAICIPDVGDSDIRSNPRSQIEHSLRMNWDIERYGEHTRQIRLTVLCNSFESLRHIDSLRKQLGSSILLNIYYSSIDGIRPVIVGHRFRPRENDVSRIIPENSMHFRQLITTLRVPQSDIVLLWPEGILLTEDMALLVFSRAMNILNSTGVKDGVIDEIYYSINAGISYVLGKHSIIIPTCRDVDYVLPAIKSALSQDSKDFEVIVVNDNPENSKHYSQLHTLYSSWEKVVGSEELLEHLIVINHKFNRNASAARNTGIIQSSGEYVSFLDDDDYYEPNRLTAVETGLRNNNDNIGACYCGYTGSWNGKKNIERFPEGNLGDLILLLQYNEHYMCTNTVTFKRSCLNDLCGYNESYNRHQDIELMVRFFSMFNIKSHKEYLVINRPNPVPETFTPNINNMIRLKYNFITDMKNIIKSRDQEFIENVIDAHCKDIGKIKDIISPSQIHILKELLLSALT